MRQNGKPNLVLIRGGAGQLGPISRLGLRDRFSHPSNGRLYLFLSTKVVLIGAILYYLYG